MSPKIWLLIATLLGASGVALGAYHAHGLEAMLQKRSPDSAHVAKRLGQCETGVRYQMYHALAIFGVGLLLLHPSLRPRECWLIDIGGALLLAGVIFFSGGLYLFVFLDNGLHWSIVPLGGLAFITGWLTLGCAALLGRNLRHGSDVQK